MNERYLTRRRFVKQSLAAVGPATLTASALPLVPAHAESGAARLTVVCVGAHPDDPESGCGGTLARYAALGHAVTVVYLTRGERGISGKSLEEAATIRSAEGEAACKIMGAKPLFFGQIDGATEVTHAQVDAMRRLLAASKPDLVFTHWSVDTHLDHQVASVLTIRAWMGHVSIDTTNIYAEVDLETKARMLAACQSFTPGRVPAKRWRDDLSLMTFLRQL